MCGILVIYKRQGLHRDDIFKACKALKAIEHRGPDGEGLVVVNSKNGEYKIINTLDTPKDIAQVGQIEDVENSQFDLLLGHRRLSIIELSSAGHQPMVDELGNWITFNGEVYNYLEIKEELKNLGVKFHTNSDTEVVLKAYRYWGANCVNKFNGMWSFVIFNNQTKKIFISNDRFGVKPLYYFQDIENVIFASEQKQFHFLNIDMKQLNVNVIDFYLQYGIIDHDEETFHKNIFRFKPSHYAEIVVNEKNNLHLIKSQKRYYSVPEKIDKSISATDALDEFRYLIKDSVKLRLRADVPVAFALSGGLDSSIILYIAAKLFKEQGIEHTMSSYSAIFKGFDGDESMFMEILEKEMNLNSSYIEPMNEFNIIDFEKHIYYQDEPILSTSFYAAWCIYKSMAKTDKKILFVGQGADEVFAGYHHHAYRYFRNLLLKIRPVEYMKQVNAYAHTKGWSTKEIHSYVYHDIKKISKNLFEHKNSFNQFEETLFDRKLNTTFKKDLTQTMLPNYLKCDDRSSMAFGIETRHPFMDYRLINFGMQLPDNLKISNGWQKHLLRLSVPEMNKKISFRTDKKGFTTPQKRWIYNNKQEFGNYLNHIPKDIEKSTDSFRNYAMGCWFKLQSF